MRLRFRIPFLTVLAVSLLTAFPDPVHAQKGGGKKGGGGGGEPPPVAPVHYSLDLVSPLEVGAFSEIHDVNSSGLAVGSSNITTAEGPLGRGIVYDVQSKLTIDVNELINDPSWNVSEITSINERGWMAGIGSSVAVTGGAFIAVLITPDLDDDGNYELQPLATLNSDTKLHLNNDGDVVGSHSTPDGFEAFIWTAEHGVVGLGFGGSYGTFAQGVNDRIDGTVQIVVTDGSTSGGSNVAWSTVFDAQTGTASPLMDLGFLYSDRRYAGFSGAAAINSFGVIAGVTTVSKDNAFAATYVHELGWTSLGSLSSSKTSWNNSWATDINDSQWTIGESMYDAAPRIDPFLHVNSVGMFNLLDLMDAADVAALDNRRLVPAALSNANHVGGRLNSPPNGSFFERRGVVLTPVENGH